MRSETPAHLWDAIEAAKRARAAVDGLSAQEYLDDWIRQSAVERQIEVLGEALNRIRKSDHETSERIPDLRAIVATRNLIVHQYDDVDHVRVLAMLNDDLPSLLPVLEGLLGEADAP